MTIERIVNTLIKDLSQVPHSSYAYYPGNYCQLNSSKVFEENNNIVFKCLAAGVSEKDIDITFDKKKLCVKTSSNVDNKVFKSNINESIILNRSIDVKNSFAKLKEGILTVTMPIDKKDTKHKISFK